jgi:hypothetical protein
MSTALLLVLFGAVGLMCALLMWFEVLKTPHMRYLVAGIVLFVIGAISADRFLPESNARANSLPPRGVAILPPFLPQGNQEFKIGLVAHPQGCNNPVEITIVADGTEQYWLHHDSHPYRGKPFALVLPGHYGKPSVKLGYEGSDVSSNLAHTEPSPQASRDVHSYVEYRHEVTIIGGHVEDWSKMREPLIVQYSAPLITHRGIDDCNLQLPALLGEPSARTLVAAYECKQLDRRYYRTVCTDPPAAGDASRHETSIAPSLEVSQAVSAVAGDVSTAASYPQPTGAIGENTDWTCRPAPAAITLSAQGAGAAGGVTLASQDDCNTVATIISSTWHRDFVLALIGAFLAVGIHMMWEALIEKRHAEEDLPPRRTRRRLPRRSDR